MFDLNFKSATAKKSTCETAFEAKVSRKDKQPTIKADDANEADFSHAQDKRFRRISDNALHCNALTIISSDRKTHFKTALT